MAVSDRMPDHLDVFSFFEAVAQQDAEKLRSFFEPDATIVWANTHEQFTVDEYIRANCEYPGEWEGCVEEIQCCSRFHDDNRITVVAKVWDGDGNASRTVSFIEFGDTEGGLIRSMAEYWGDVAEPPKWRQDLGIGQRYEDEK